MRLFDVTAFYVKLVITTIYDIKGCMLIFRVSLFMFRVPMVIISLDRKDDKIVVEDVFGNWPTNMLINQYLLALGGLKI